MMGGDMGLLQAGWVAACFHAVTNAPMAECAPYFVFATAALCQQDIEPFKVTRDWWQQCERGTAMGPTPR